MADRPFQCPKCRNWYTPLPTDPDLMCRLCADRRHAVHPKLGVDCHWGQESSTPSEIGFATLLEQARAATSFCEGAVQKIAAAPDQAKVTELLAQAEASLQALEQAQMQVPRLLEWAGVMEMPGMVNEKSEARFLAMEGIERLVGMKRRPPEDLVTLKRSVRLCREMAAEAPGSVAQARLALLSVRKAAETWHPASVPVRTVQNPTAPVETKARKPRSEAQRIATAKWQAAGRAKRAASAVDQPASV